MQTERLPQSARSRAQQIRAVLFRALLTCALGTLASCGGERADDSDGGRGGSAAADDPDRDGEDVDGDGEPDPRSTIVEPTEGAKRGLCLDEYQSVKLDYDKVTRGSWQYNPGGSAIALGEHGYPCRAFLHDAMRPSPFDVGWTSARDRDFVGFREVSTVAETGYTTAQFRYFRTLIFVPEGARLSALTLEATGIDDALYLAIYNSAHPEGTSPVDAGPADPAVGACSGNGVAMWDVRPYIVRGEINMLLLVHADMSPMTSSLISVEVLADGEPMQMVSCEGV